MYFCILPIDSSVDFVGILKTSTRSVGQFRFSDILLIKPIFVNAVYLETVSHSLLKISIQGCRQTLLGRFDC